METVISVGVLAVAVPLTLAAIGESGKSGQASAAETRAPWIAAATFGELRAASEGRSPWFTAGADGRVTPPADAIWALGFSRSGAVLEMLSEENYTSGILKSGDDEVRFIARVHPAEASAATNTNTTSVTTAIPAMRVTVEYPSAAPANRRKSVDFHAHLR